MASGSGKIDIVHPTDKWDEKGNGHENLSIGEIPFVRRIIVTLEKVIKTP